MNKIEVQFSRNLAKFAVSLFMREWIEIVNRRQVEKCCIVSLFMREWIEIPLQITLTGGWMPSPSL